MHISTEVNNMKFSSSAIAIGALQRDVDVLAINSMAKLNPETVLSFDDYLYLSSWDKVYRLVPLKEEIKRYP